MTNKKYKIAVFTDLKKNAVDTIKSSISLANVINSEIEVFNVKSPTDIIKRENQLNAVRSLKDQHIETRMRMMKLINPINEAHNLNIKYSFTFGNVKDEIIKFIDEKQPDVIVLGKRKAKMLNILGDSITKFVLQNYPGLIMIADDKNALHSNNELTLGLLNSKRDAFNADLVGNLMANTNAPLNFFKVNSSQEKNDTQPLNTKNAVEYVFEQNDQAITYISNYLSKSKVNLLFVNRKDAIKSKLRANTKFNELIDKTNVSILFA